MRAKTMLYNKIANSQPKYWLIVGIFACAALMISISVYQELYAEPNAVSVPLTGESVVPSPSATSIAQPSEGADVTLLFGGDMQFDRYIRQQVEFHGSYAHLLDRPLRQVLAESDGAIANLEGPITDFDSVSIGSAIGSKNNYLFTFSPEVASTLRDLHFLAVNLGNNHILNFGEEGLKQTRAYLDSAGVAHWGSTGGESWLEDSFLALEVGDFNFLFVNYNQFLWGDFDMLVAEMAVRREEIQPDFMVVYTHWGTEYQTTASERYREMARQLVEVGGADMVVGSHPHVVQQNEVIAGAPVYYSLGNFIFDQYFEAAVRKGVLLKVTFSMTNPISVEEVPIYLDGTGKTILSPTL